MARGEEIPPPSGQEYVKWRLEDIALRLEKTDERVRGMREDVAVVKSEVKGVATKMTWLCGQMTDVREEVEGHQKKIAVNESRIGNLGKDIGGKVNREAFEKEMGKVSMFMRVFLFMIGGLLIAAAVKIVVGIS